MNRAKKRHALFEPILRPRIQELLAPAYNHALTCVVSGCGTGKTQAVSDFVTQSGAVVVWHDASTLDNFDAHFFQSILRDFQKSLPAFGDALADIKGPPSLAVIDRVLSIWQKTTRGIPLVFLVIDNCERLHSSVASRYLMHMVQAALPNLRIILLSGRQMDTSLGGLVRADKIHHLSKSDLAFRYDEIDALLSAWHITHTGNHVQRILDATDGWSYAVAEYARQLVTAADTPSIDAAFDPIRCFQLLRSEWFLPFDRTTQLLLIKLSLLPAFSMEIVKMLTAEDSLPTALEDFLSNLFIYFDPEHKLFRFQANYQQLLKAQSFFIADSVTEALYRQCGEWFERHGFMIEAIDCYGKIGQYEKAFFILQRYALPQIERYAAFYVKQFMDALPPSFYEEHPIAHVMVANLRIGEGRMEEARALLLSLQAKYEALPLDDQSAQVLGEVYLSLAEMGLYQAHGNVLPYAEKAYELLPYGSVFRCDDRLIAFNESIIVLPECDTDTLPTMVKQHQGMRPFEDRLYGRYARGFSTLYEGEVLLAQGEAHQAKAKLYEALRTGLSYDRHDVVCNALALLAQLAPLTGDLNTLLELSAECQEYVQQRGLTEQRKFCDYISAWIYTLLQDYGRIPKMIKDPFAFSQMPQKMLTSREMSAHCLYWISIEDFERAQVMIDFGKRFAKEHNYWVAQIHFHILNAICLKRMGADQAAIDALYEAYQMAKPGQLIMPFIEGGRHMRTLINTIRRQENHPFDEEWLSLIYTKASTYAKRVNAMIQQHELKQRDVAPVKLSVKEQQVLELLVAGLTRDEISERMNITVHGVKRHITSLYNKLGAANRSDAIRLATAFRLIENDEYVS